jgi:cob(I)alamin adenosyltransferase
MVYWAEYKAARLGREEAGMIHIYTGDGKGKTTAAVGLAVRAAGCGKRVVLAQFLKGSRTGELKALARIPLITIIRNTRDYGFYGGASDETRAQMACENNANLQNALALPCEMLVLDEVCAAYNLGAIDRKAVDELVLREAGRRERELVLTGRDAPAHLCAAADYLSRVSKIKHPFDHGTPARQGIEY